MLFCYHPIPGVMDNLQGFQALLETLRARELPELAAVLSLNAEPSVEALHEVIRAWTSLEFKFKASFLRLLRKGSWYCSTVADALEREDGFESLEAALPDVENKEQALQRWIADPAAAIRAGWWEDKIQVSKNHVSRGFKPHFSYEDVLSLLHRYPLNPQLYYLLCLLTEDMDTLPLEVIEMLLERIPELEMTWRGYPLILRLFAQSPMNNLLGRFRWPKHAQNDYHYRSSLVSTELLTSVRRRIELLTSTPDLLCWEACSMIPLLEPYWGIRSVEPLRLPQGCYGSIHATDNKAACLGGILSLLKESLSPEDRLLLEADLKDFLSDTERCTFLARACKRFCTEGKLLLHRLASEIEPASEDHRRELQIILGVCVRGLRADLENAPAKLEAV